jgi:hypothetical protein
MQVLFTPPGTIRAEDKNSLKEAGYLVIEVEDVSKIKFASPIDMLSGNDIVDALLWSLTRANSGPTHQAYVGEYIVKQLVKQRKIPNP